MALFTLRFFQLGWRVITGKVDKLISSHEVEDEMEEAMEYEINLDQSNKDKENK